MSSYCMYTHKYNIAHGDKIFFKKHAFFLKARFAAFCLIEFAYQFFGG